MPPILYIYVPLHYYCSLNIASQKQQTAPLIYHTIIIYVPATNMPLKCHIYSTYANYFMHRYEAAMLKYIPHMNLLQWTMQPEALVYMHSTLLNLSWTYMPFILHIYILPHFYCNLHIDLTLLHTSIKNHQTAIFIYHTTAKYVPTTNMSLKCQYMPNSQIIWHASIGELC